MKNTYSYPSVSGASKETCSQARSFDAVTVSPSGAAALPGDVAVAGEEQPVADIQVARTHEASWPCVNHSM
jgi:hypothetical protein